MPKNNEAQGPSLFEQIQSLQSKVAGQYQGFTEDEKQDLETYSSASRAANFQENYEDLSDPRHAALRQTAERLGTLAAHYPKNSPALAALREQIPDIGRLRKEKMEALRADAGRTGMDKLLNDFFGSKRRAAKEELEKMRQSRTSIDGRDRTNTVKAPEHAGKGRNIYTAITNKSALGTYAERHNDNEDFPNGADRLSFRTKSGLLEGAKIPPFGEENGKVVVVFCGSGEPAEAEIEDIAESYTDSGATVVVFNYRGFGKSKTLDSSGKQIGTPLSEQSLYEDGMEMYKYVRDVMGVAPANITLHGYSMGAAVASHVAANIAEQNRLKENNGITVPDSRKLGGIVLQSPIETMYNAAKELTNSSFMAYFGSRGSGDYNTRENMRRLHQNDPDIPVAYISGTQQGNDHLSLEVTHLHQDTKARFKNASHSITDASHLDRSRMLSQTHQHILVATDGRNAKLNPPSISRQEEPAVQTQTDIPSIVK